MTSSFHRRLALLLWLGAISLALLPATAQMAPVGNGGPGPVKAQHLTVEMVSAGPAIAKGGKQTVGFVFTMEDGWHVYWKNAGFAGYPPRVHWTLPKGVAAGELLFPAPDRLPLDTSVDYGYEDNATYPVVIEASSAALPDKSGNVHVGAKVDWLVCKQVCVPGKADLGLDLRLEPLGTVVAKDGEHVGPIAGALSHLPLPLPARFKATAVSQGDQILLTFVTGTRETDAEFYPLKEDEIADTASQPTEPLENGVRVHMTRSPNAKVTPKSLQGLIKLSGDESYIITADVVPGTIAPVAAAGSSVSHVTVVSALALALLGGMILNLMPCVFPVLFLKALSLMQSSGEERSRMRLHGLVYTLGILASFWAIVSALLLLRAGGQQFGWGFQLQSPNFVAVLALFLFFFALSLAGMFDLGLSLTSAGDSLTRKQGLTGSFFTGVLATVVATPCVGPFMGVAIGFALAQPASVTFAVFTALAVGLALPYLALTIWPALMRRLPKPGAWMEVLKQLTAVPLFATVIWLVWVYGQLFSGVLGISRMAMLLTAMLVVAVASWVLGRWPANRTGTIVAAAIAVLAFAIPLSQGRSVEAKPTAWQPFSQAGLDAARAGGKSVFVDYTAAWCLSCQVNERVVLNTEDVQQRLAKSGFVQMRADWTQYDPAITAALNAVGRSGVPTYVIYPAKSGTTPDVLPEVLTKGLVTEAIDRDSR